VVGVFVGNVCCCCCCTGAVGVAVGAAVVGVAVGAAVVGVAVGAAVVGVAVGAVVVGAVVVTVDWLTGVLAQGPCKAAGIAAATFAGTCTV
jgi:hypothetical protein